MVLIGEADLAPDIAVQDANDRIWITVTSTRRRRSIVSAVHGTAPFKRPARETGIKLCR